MFWQHGGDVAIQLQLFRIRCMYDLLAVLQDSLATTIR
jgi:hypothetical protein